MPIKCVFAVCFVTFVYTVISCAAGYARIIRGVSKAYAPFELEIVIEESGHLTGTAHYFDDRSPDVSHLPVTIDGIRTADGGFWPDLSVEVSNEIGNNWSTIKRDQPDGERAKIILQANSQNEWLHVDLEPFRSVRDKYKYGRITLTNGEKAVFKLENLSAPKGAPHYWHESTFTKVDTSPTPSLSIVAILSPDGRDVFASCEFRNDGLSTMSLNGTRTADRKFWPYVTRQVSNDVTGTWTTIASREDSGTPSTSSIESKQVVGELYVNLDSFRPLIGKFRYGRILLSTGDAAVFEMRSILPPEEGEN